VASKSDFPPAIESPSAEVTSAAMVRQLLTEIMAMPAMSDDAPLEIRFQDLVQKPFLQEVMKLTKGNQSKASKLLGLNRHTIKKRLRRYGLHR
jgi:Fis family transcriptional regulator, factor for inversion stimulation protein